MGKLTFLYLQIPLSALLGTARQTWNDQSSVLSSLSTLKGHILREQYGTFKLTLYKHETGFGHNLKHWINQSTTDFTVLPWLLAVVTIVLSYKLDKPVQRVVHVLTAMLGKATLRWYW